MADGILLADERLSLLKSWVHTALQPPADPNWRLDEFGYQPALEHSIESRCTIANGFIGSRGALTLPTPASHPRTFVAGLFDQSTGPLATSTLVPVPDWLRYRVLLDGAHLDLADGEILSHQRTLDLRRGVLLTDWHHCDPVGHVVHLRELRFASLANRALVVQVAQLSTAEPVAVVLDTWVEPTSEHMVAEQSTLYLMVWCTTHTGQRLALASTATLEGDPCHLLGRSNERAVRRRWQWTLQSGQPSTLTRLVAFARSNGHEHEHDKPDATALKALREARSHGTAHLLEAHVRAWHERWAASDVVIEGNDKAQRALRFALYHLISAANPEDEHTSIGARALTGEAYQGHVFWDTDLFLLPFYCFTWPAAARALLLYRYHTLPAAREKATRLGYRGACYAWESARGGAESTPPYVRRPDGQVLPVRCGTDEQHISADIAYAVWQYWLTTGDEPFLRDAGAEIVLDTARFWASRAARESDGHYHIRGVIGPDEYHEGVDDNAYTNGMAQWNLECGLEVAQVVQTRWPEEWTRLRTRLALTTDELARWQDVGDGLVMGVDPATGLIEQFTGFFDLEPVDPGVGAYAGQSVPIDLLLGPDKTQRSQVIKQADVLMLLALLWDRYPPAGRAANFAFYVPKCGHGSSLSPAIHALVAARLGEVDTAEQYFRQAAAIDLDDTMGNAGLGIHIGALGGLWQATVFGFAGLSLRAGGLRFEPHLPASWRALRFPVQWHGRHLQIALHQAPLSFTATVTDGLSLTIQVGDLSHSLEPRRAWTCRWDDAEQRWKELSR
jgi:kojibiose phosphorylase